MYLKALEIQGFKSFPDKTRLTFEKDITAIVGPNGSGKSNISDAILWVMGEKRTKALRGTKMEDVIFGGTQSRGQQGFAQVSLILDNSDRLLDSENMEIMITRRCYRSGESEFFLNRQPVRLKDISELFMDTGLGRDGYSIIGQGKISEIISAKSTDRREIFEEAAGISRFRYRKEESERKLERTDENLVRINDKIDELELQVGPLREQAEIAKKYLLLRDELRGLEVSVWMENLDRTKANAESVTADYEDAKSRLAEAQAELQGMYDSSENLTAKMREKDLELESVRVLLSGAESSAAECESAAAVLRSNIKNNELTIERMRRELSEQSGRSESLEQQAKQQQARVCDIEAQKLSLEGDAAAVIRRSEENAAGAGEAQRELAELVSKENEKNEALARGQTLLAMLAESSQQFMDRESSCASELQELSRRLEELSEKSAAAGSALEKTKSRAAELENVISGYKIRMQSREKTVEELRDRQTRLTVDLRSMDSRISMLTEMEKEYEGFSKAVRTIMREASRGTAKGVRGPVASLLRTEDKYTLALETALGAAMQNIIVDTPEDGKACIELLKKRDGGRGTFMPVSVIKPSDLKNEPVGEAGYLGTAAQLVSCEREYENIFSNLLGRTAVAETLGDAVAIAKKYDYRFRIVTLDGQLVNAGGSMTGGSASKNAGILSRANELKRLTDQRKKLAEDGEICAEKLSEALREYNAVKYELDVAGTELSAVTEDVIKREGELSQFGILINAAEERRGALELEKKQVDASSQENQRRIADSRTESENIKAELEQLRVTIAAASEGCEGFEETRTRLSQELSALRESIASLDAERSATCRAIEQLEELRRDLMDDSEARQDAIGEAERSAGELAVQLDEKEARLRELADRTQALKDRITEASGLRMELEGQRNRSEKSAQNRNRDIIEMERVCARFEQKKLAADMEEKQIIDRLWDTYELSRTAAQSMRAPVESLQKAQKQISELKRSISALGNPNIGAIDEYQRVSERYEFLTEQRDDVQKAKNELEKIITDITKEMREIFRREFKAIDESFRKTFLELFGGGRAALLLEDEDDILNCGIEIQVQPPGKALSTISLMSGGEMAFVAIALYFAIIKIRPTPFCVMDEIEAALDEANVIRFAEYMRTMTGKTQFIVITHRRGTMEEADMLYGVTMQEKGVSRVLSVDLQEAEKSIAG